MSINSSLPSAELYQCLLPFGYRTTLSNLKDRHPNDSLFTTREHVSDSTQLFKLDNCLQRPTMSQAHDPSRQTKQKQRAIKTACIIMTIISIKKL